MLEDKTEAGVEMTLMPRVKGRIEADTYIIVKRKGCWSVWQEKAAMERMTRRNYIPADLQILPIQIDEGHLGFSAKAVAL